MMIMKIRNTIYWLFAMAMTACTADEVDWQLTPEQQSLIGQGVDFSATMASPFTTRATYHHDGSFNEGDQMRIFRQYATDATGTAFDATTEAFRTYYLVMNYATGTSVSLNSDWRPMKDKLKSDKPGETATQTSADSLTWENGKTVRFRAWGRSNLAGCMASKKDTAKAHYYPDYTVSDWVTVSGPTQSIPLTMRHIACRISLTCKAGNEFAGADVCTKVADYRWNDNADTEKNDAKETGKTEVQAQAQLDSVMAVYNKMCMPAGVDDNTFLLTAMTSSLYDAADTDFQNLEKYSETDGIVKIGTKSATEIEKDVQHPLFKNNDGKQYLVSIPIDMSNSEDCGKELVLPPCTRFKVWLYYVNGEGHSESKCHIFTLSDIKDKQGNAVFKDGLTLKAGYSYSFNVGYQYDKFTITASDNFSWTDETLPSEGATDASKTIDEFDYSWWKNALKDAANTGLEGKKYLPEFTITDQKQFATFIHLVNGTAAKQMSGLTRGEVRKENNAVVKNAEGFPTYWWKKVDANGDTIKITREEAEIDGYVFYPHFYPTIGTQLLHEEEDYIHGPINFYDTELGNRYVVQLSEDIDMNDISLPSIGNTLDNAFRGNFKGNGKKLSNLNMSTGYLFGYVNDGAITNLRIESTHNTCLLNTAEPSGTLGWGCRIAGISMLCPSETNSIAKSLTGSSYVVGCIHVGKATGALVGTADNLTMLGCMQAADGIANGTGALVGNSSVKFGKFMYNYYDVELSPGTNAVGTTTDKYDYDDYIRGAKSHILKAKNDYMIGADVDISKLNANMKKEMYGMAPWKAMNLGIVEYNGTTIGAVYPCNLRYEQSAVGYIHRYPILK